MHPWPPRSSLSLLPASATPRPTSRVARAAATLLALAALAACDVPQGPVSGTVPTVRGDLPIAVVAADMPPMGSARLDLEDVSLAFQSVCLDTLPRFEGADEVVRRQGLAQNPATGTWYDPSRELSVNLEPKGGRPVCSIVFASGEEPGMLGIGLSIQASTLGGGSGDIGMDPGSGFSTTTLGGGATMRFEPGVGGRRDLHRVVVLGAR